MSAMTHRLTAIFASVRCSGRFVRTLLRIRRAAVRHWPRSPIRKRAQPRRHRAPPTASPISPASGAPTARSSTTFPALSNRARNCRCSPGRRSWRKNACRRTIRKRTACPRECPGWPLIRGRLSRLRSLWFFFTRAIFTPTGRFFWTAAVIRQDPNPTWYGDSTGKWEGDTLVVDSVGFNDKFWFDFAGHPAHREAACGRALSPARFRPSGLRRDG